MADILLGLAGLLNFLAAFFGNRRVIQSKGIRVASAIALLVCFSASFFTSLFFSDHFTPPALLSMIGKLLGVVGALKSIASIALQKRTV